MARFRFPIAAWRGSCAACALLALPSSAALAQAAAPLPTALPPVPVATEAEEDAAGIGTATTARVPAATLRDKAARTDDTAALLRSLPGVDLAPGGGLSGLPVVNGLADDRIKILVDGVPISAACANHMNPPLSYIAPTRVGAARVVAGVTPVSAGGDSIAGTITVDPKAPVYAADGEDLHVEGQVSVFFRSNADALTTSADVAVATRQVSLGAALSRAEAGNYHDGNGAVVQASRYKTYIGDVTLGLRGASDTLILRGGETLIPVQGFPSQLMDMTYNQSVHANAHYLGDFGWGHLDARAYWQQVHHKMNFLFGWANTPVNAGMPMLTEGATVGYSVTAEMPVGSRDTVRLGNEFDRFTLEEWWPPVANGASAMMGPKTFQNINDGERNRIGTFAEWERTWTPRWTTQFGVRNDTVVMDAGPVRGYNGANTSGMMATYYGTDAAAFNARDRTRIDANIDLTALVRFAATDSATAEAGYARKNRSPNLYERYAWSSSSMAASMVGWFGDYHGYVGNLDLKPETANTLSLTGDWHDPGAKTWQVTVTPYYTYVEDYIGADRLRSYNGHAVNNAITTLQFANHDAQMFGVSVSGRTVLARDTGFGDFNLGAKAGWVRGWQVNDGRNLYHLMPLNGQLTLDHRWGGWRNGVEISAVAGKTRIDTTRSEPTTPGYALVNLRTAYDWDQVTFGVGIDNLFNKQYYEPLGGVDYKDYRYSHAAGTMSGYPPLAAAGRSFNAGVTVRF